MDSSEAILLALVQGVTEFLPVSSSGHLRLGQHLLGMQEPPLLFDVVLHLGTLVAVVLVLRRQLGELVVASLRGAALVLRGRAAEAWALPQARLAALIVLATIPTGLIGLLLGDWLEGLASTPGRVGVVLILNGTLLFSTRWMGRKGEETDAAAQPPRLSVGAALAIGVAQGLAVTRGISRSGSTIVAGLALGLPRDFVGSFSFLLSIPAILGALVLEFDLSTLRSGNVAPQHYGIGLLVSALVGVLCLELLLKVVRRGQLHHFAYYCWGVGLAALLWEMS